MRARLCGRLAPPPPPRAAVAQPSSFFAARSYMIFTASKREEVKKANPGIAVTEISKVIGAQWRALSDKEKDAFKAKCAAGK